MKTTKLKVGDKIWWEHESTHFVYEEIVVAVCGRCFAVYSSGYGIIWRWLDGDQIYHKYNCKHRKKEQEERCL